MSRVIEINSWKRKSYYQFFSSFDEPFFGITAQVNCTTGYKNAKKRGTSFFIYYLYKSLLAVNAIEELRTRIVDEKIILYDKVHASSTIGRSDNSFGYSFIEFEREYSDFEKNAKAEIEFVRNVQGLNLNENTGRIDTIHYSAIPWIKFNGLTHARNFKFNDSIPKLTFGKVTENKGEKIMPVSINLHHGLADAYHAGKYFELFEQYLNG